MPFFLTCTFAMGQIRATVDQAAMPAISASQPFVAQSFCFGSRRDSTATAVGWVLRTRDLEATSESMMDRDDQPCGPAFAEDDG